MVPEFPSAARISEYVCDLDFLFSQMNVGSYGLGGSSCMVKITPNAPNLDHAKNRFSQALFFENGILVQRKYLFYRLCRFVLFFGQPK